MTSIDSRRSFTSLPPEIRNEIYTHLFLDAKLGVSTVHSSGPLCGSFCSCAWPWGIINTCRLLRNETIPLLLAATTLEVTNRIDKTALLPAHYLSSISRAVVLDAKLFCTVPTMATLLSPIPREIKPNAGFPLDKFSSLRVFELRNISVWCKYYEESYLASPDADECMYNLAIFNLKRISPALVDLCNKKDRGFKILLGCQFVGNSTRHETVHAVIDVDTHEILQKTKGATIRDRNAWAGFY